MGGHIEHTVDGCVFSAPTKPWFRMEETKRAEVTKGTYGGTNTGFSLVGAGFSPSTVLFYEGGIYVCGYIFLEVSLLKENVHTQFVGRVLPDLKTTPPFGGSQPVGTANLMERGSFLQTQARCHRTTRNWNDEFDEHTDFPGVPQ